MARDWDDEPTTIKLLEARLQEIAPDNIAPIPLSVCQENTDAGLVWGVHVHVKIRGVTEYDVEAYARTYTGALRRAYLGLANEAKIRRQTARANAQFQVAV